MSTSMTQSGDSCRMRRIDAAKIEAPPSGRSSRVTDVRTACRKPNSCTVVATRAGSSASRSVGRPLAMAQKPHARVQTSPRSSNVVRIVVRSGPTHRVQALTLDELTEPQVARPTGEAHLEPVGLWVARRG